MDQSFSDRQKQLSKPQSASAEADMAARLMMIILNFNGIEDTLACLESLHNQTRRDFSVQVIDNGSDADDLSRIAARYPDVELIPLPENLGWAGGNNFGMRLALERGFNYVCLVNNDTVFDPSATEELLAAAAMLGDAFLLHPSIAYFADPNIWQVDPQPDSSIAASDRERAFASRIAEMHWACGACLFLPTALLKRLGLLDERFFLQLEETDYFHRAKAQGVRSFCARRARILHKESVSFGGRVTEAKTYYQVRNRFLLAEKHTPSIAGFYDAFRSLLWTLYNQALNRNANVTGWPSFLRWVLSRDPIALAARQGMRDYARRRFGPRRIAGARS